MVAIDYDTDDTALLDIDKDYDALARELDIDRTRTSAIRLYANRTFFDGAPLFDHCHAVALGCRRIAASVWQADTVGARRYWTKACEAAGLLHEAPHSVGLLFEDLVEAANASAAVAVAVATADWRQPRPRRNASLVSALSANAGAPDDGLAALVLKLADIRVTAKCVHDLICVNHPLIADRAINLCYEARQVLPIYTTASDERRPLVVLYDVVHSVVESTDRLVTAIEQIVFGPAGTPNRRHRGT